MTLDPGREEVRYALDKGAAVQHGENRGTVWKAKELLKVGPSSEKKPFLPAFVREAPVLHDIVL